MSAPSTRMLALLSLLQSRRDWPGQLLAERLEISPRTIRRDVDRLRELGYRVAATKGPDGGYRLEAGSELPPLLFDDEQALALALALQTAPTAGTGLEDAALRALATVRQMMPSRLRHRMDALRISAIRDPSAADVPVDVDTLLLLSEATAAHQTVRFEYGDTLDAPDTAMLRRAEPHHLLAWRGRWYLLAWDLDRDDWRTFRVERITPRTHTGPRFRPREIPGGDAEKYVASRFRGMDVAGEWPCSGEVIVSAPARDLAPYLPDAVIEQLVDGRCRVTLGSWSWHGLAASLGAFDADLEVVGPSELTDAFARLSRRYAAGASTPSEQNAQRP
jgi:predicted DNA-binding transcriptional regulator YafY